MKIIVVAGARPNYMKIAPILRAAEQYQNVECTLVHTGQHYDYEMSEKFFKDLSIRTPDHFLNVGSGSHAVQTANIMVSFEKICMENRPDWVMVVGDVNSTLACALVAKKLHIGVAHVEAGLRSFDRDMPEEINRLVTDAITDLFFVTEESGVRHLLNEGHDKMAIHFVGHVMIDNLLYQKGQLERADFSSFAYAELKPSDRDYAFMTLHRPSNVDDKGILAGIAGAVSVIAKTTPIIFPVHPRTRKNIDAMGIEFHENVKLLPPLGFKEALWFWKDAAVVLTDSGGLQEETTALGIPCVTIRENTERPVTVEVGTNQLSGNSPDSILAAYENAPKKAMGAKVPPLWDGQASDRIWKIMLANL